MNNIIDSIQLSGVTYTLQGSGGGTVSSAITSGDTNAVAGGAVYDKFDEVEQVTARALNDLDEKINPTVELTQAEYDALVSAGTVSADTYYIISDATAFDPTTKVDTSAFTAYSAATNTALNNKVDTSAITSSVTSASTDSEIPTAKAVWEAASGGGTTYTAGRGIDITNDTISVSLPISAGTGDNSIIEGQNTKATGSNSHAEGRSTSATSQYSHAEGWSTIANGYYGSHAEGKDTKATGGNSHAEGSGTESYGQMSHAEGYHTLARGSGAHAEGWFTTTMKDFAHAEGNYTSAMTEASHAEGNYTKTTNKYEHASGSYNNTVSASTTFGDSGNTLFSVGNGTAENARHNAFEIRQNGDIYLSSGGTDIKLQDYLGGSSITVDTALDSASTNPVENRVIYNKIDEIEQVTAAGLNAVNDKFDGLKLKKLTQAEYNALATKDSNTLYIVI